jgi:predicted DCC family thiol-disulfide oxidoreductase YuxK
VDNSVPLDTPDTLRGVQQRNGLLIFDGDCGFCSTSANWISRRWPRESDVSAVPWQRLSPEAAAKTHLSQDDFKRAAWWIDGDRSDEGARAVARALIAAGGLWAIAGWTLLVPPISWLARLGYRIVARYRYRLPGGTPACRV